MSNAAPPLGVLLVNLGTPASPAVADVRRYLREFLSDPRVLDMPAPGRWALLHLYILRFRPRTSAAAYAKIWTAQGSPLTVISQALRDALAEHLGPGFRVELAMRYGEPTIPAALNRFAEANVKRIILVPLFPQYASSTTGSTLERVANLVARSTSALRIEPVEPFYADPGYISALAAVTEPELERFVPDHVLMSFHGLPESHVHKSDASGQHCLKHEGCCLRVAAVNRDCYRAHCFATSRALAAALDLSEQRYSVSFQSRAGPSPWIKPYTDRLLPELAQRGIRRLAVLCPSFVADCIETLEEIGIRAREQWRDLGGADFHLVPCLNSHPRWVEGLAQIVHAQALSVST